MGWAAKIEAARQERKKAQEARRAARDKARAADQEARAKMEQAAAEQRQAHQQLLEQAVGIGILDLVCHEETWWQVAEMTRIHTGQGRWWGVNLPPTTPVDDGSGLLSIELSGVRVVDILNAANSGKTALARRVYSEISAVVSTVAASDGDNAIVRLDDRPRSLPME